MVVFSWDRDLLIELMVITHLVNKSYESLLRKDHNVRGRGRGTLHIPT
jgi:hypothetical protein